MFRLAILFIFLNGIFAKQEGRILQQNFEPAAEEFVPNTEIQDVSQKGKYIINHIIKALDTLMHRPVLVLVHDKESVIRDARSYLTRIIANVGSEFWLMKFNSSGVTTPLVKSSKVDQNEFMTRLDADSKTFDHLGQNREKGGVAFFGILKAIHTIPQGSGILLFTDEIIQDEYLAALALKEARDKGVRIFTVWQGLYTNYNNEYKIIQEVSSLSGGILFVGNTERKVENLYNDYYLQHSGATYVESIIVHESLVKGRNILHFPIDAGVMMIHVSLSNVVSKAFLTTPKGYLINLLNVTDVGRFSRGSYVVIVGENYEIQLNTAQNYTTPSVGMWRLETNVEDAIAPTYNITVAVQNDLILNSQLVNTTQDVPTKVHINLQGDFTKIDNITLKNDFGEPIHGNLKYTINENENEALDMEIETFNEKEFDIDLKDIPFQTKYIQVDGKDREGNEFVRLAYFEKYAHINREVIVINVGSNSDMIIAPNTYPKVYFDVLNNINSRVFMSFLVQDEKRLLRRMYPLGAWLNPKQSITVTVELYTRPEFGNSYTDTISFSADSGPYREIKNAILTIGQTSRYDNDNPRLKHRYSSNCLRVLIGNCESAFWTIEVIAEDEDSGLLSVVSNPPGLYFPQGYTTGTREEVRGYYTGSCCSPKLLLTATDITHNTKSYEADAYHPPLSPGAIAGIVIGVILLVLLIILIICLCVKGKCKCKRKESASVDLPSATYRGPVNSSSTRRY